VRAGVFGHKKRRAGSQGTGAAPQHGVLPAPIGAQTEAPTGAPVARGSRSVAQRIGAAPVLQPALVRPQRPEAGTAVVAVPEVGLQSVKLSDADHTV
jgi:hypothetical protein